MEKRELPDYCFWPFERITAEIKTQEHWLDLLLEAVEPKLRGQIQACVGYLRNLDATAAEEART